MRQLLSLTAGIPWIASVLLTTGLAPVLAAQGPDATPKTAGTIKAVLSTDLVPLFQRQMNLIEKRRTSWLQPAEKANSEALAQAHAARRCYEQLLP